jgi:hypothetical protein
MINIKSKQGHSIEFTDINADRNGVDCVSFRCSTKWLYDHGPTCSDCSAFIRFITKGIDDDSRITRGGGLIANTEDDGVAWTIQVDDEQERLIDVNSFAGAQSHFDNLFRIEEPEGILSFRFKLLPLDTEFLKREFDKSLEFEHYLRCHVLHATTRK